MSIGQSLMAQAVYQLTNNFAVLCSGSSVGLTLETIMDPGDDVDTSSISSTFQSYLVNNFSSLDSDGDGYITSDDLTSYANQLSASGLSYDELVNLCYTGSASSQLEEVLANFNEIDANGDGRVTDEEISGYTMDKEIEEMKEDHPEYTDAKISNYMD